MLAPPILPVMDNKMSHPESPSMKDLGAPLLAVQAADGLQLLVLSGVTLTAKSCLAQGHTYWQASPYLMTNRYRNIKAGPSHL